MNKIREFFEEFEMVETAKEYEGYYYSAGEAVIISILGLFCGLRDMKQIQRWAVSENVRSFLRRYFGIFYIPSYTQFTVIIGIIEPKSLENCFREWVKKLLPENKKGLTVSLDGKTVKSTAHRNAYEKPLHIISAHIAELGITFAQESVQGKTNESKTVQELLKVLDISGAVVVADALNCQTKTATAILNKGADYLLCAKGNQANTRDAIEEYVQNDELRVTMESAQTVNNRSDRLETRTAYVASDVTFSPKLKKWQGLACVAAIHTQVETITPGSEKTSSEWHYYISSKNLTAAELLKYARNEWSVESMHWLLDVHFQEDFCAAINENTQKSLNILRKLVLNALRLYKSDTGSKSPFSMLLFDNLLNVENIVKYLNCF